MHIISLLIREFRENRGWEGHTYLTSVYEIPYISECTVKTYDILESKEGLLSKVCEQRHTICNLPSSYA